MHVHTAWYELNRFEDQMSSRHEQFKLDFKVVYYLEKSM